MSNLSVFGSWARIPLNKRKYLEPQSVECILIGYAEESKGYNLLNIRIKNILIERSVLFEEPLQDLQVVEKETAKPLSNEDSGDENQIMFSDISDVISDIS